MPLVLAQDKIGIEMKDSFKPGENITLLVSLYDSNNLPIKDSLDIILQDSSKNNILEAKVNSQELSSLNIDKNAPFGFWTIVAKYKDATTSKSFTIEENEEAVFTLENDVLTVTNTGNTLYRKTLQILIGDSVGSKNIELGLNERVSFRLLAPDGTYNVKITDGKTTITRSNMQLTGNAIGVLDEKMAQGSSLPIGVRSPSQDVPAKNSTLVYVFVLTIVGAGILLAVERYYKRK